MSFFSKSSLRIRLIAVVLVFVLAFVTVPRVKSEWLFALLTGPLVWLDPGILLIVDAFSCRINFIWGGCDQGGGGGGGSPAADLKVNTDPTQVSQGATQIVPASPSDSDGPLSVTVPNINYIVKWSAANTPNCDLTSDGIPTVNAGIRGNIAVTNSTIGTHLYTLNCGGATDSLTVNVIGPVVNLSGITPIEMPDPLSLSWTSANVTSCTAAGEWSGNKPLMGNETIFASTDGKRGAHAFDLSCSDDSGNSTTSSRTITVLQVPRCSFSADPTTISGGSSSVLDWSCRYANTCSIDNGIGSVNPVSGSRRVRPVDPTQYTLSCDGIDGTRTFSAIVSIIGKPSIKEALPGAR